MLKLSLLLLLIGPLPYILRLLTMPLLTTLLLVFIIRSLKSNRTLVLLTMRTS
jgi:hypothetical protein